MIKITTAVRSSLRGILERSSQYDASTMQVDRNGIVSARKDADKTFAGYDPLRHYVGRADEMVNQDGTVQESW